MGKVGMVIGLGGVGVQVVHRIRNILAAGPGGKVPDSLRLLAFDMLRPSATTGRLGLPYYFLVRLPPSDEHLPASRQEARQALIQDLEKGGPSSLVMRGLSINMDALRRSGASTVDIFLVSSSFGNTGSAWLVDMAYLCRHFSKGRLPVEIHALLLTPESCQTSYQINATHRLTNFVVLKELESFQKERDWSGGISLYGNRYLAGMPGTLTAAPFSSLQILDGNGLSGQPESCVIPAAAESILCQLDEQTGQTLRQVHQRQRALAHPLGSRNLFSTVGVQTIHRPSRLLAESGVQRAILGLIDHLLPVRCDADNGRPLGLDRQENLLASDPSRSLAHWLGWNDISGVMDDIFYQSALNATERSGWVERLVARDTLQWKAALFQVNDKEQTIPARGVPESTVPLIRCHFRAYTQALAAKALSLDEHPDWVLENLNSLERTLTDYVADLGRAEEVLRRQGLHSDASAIRQRVEETRRDWESKRGSNWSRLFPQQVEEAQERHIQAKQTQVAFQQREVLLSAVRKSASLMLTFTRKLIDIYQYYVDTLALARDSLYNTTLDRLQRVNRDLETERGIRCQRLVIDEHYEENKIHEVFNRLLRRIYPALSRLLAETESHVDWLADAVQISAPLRGEMITDELLDLADQSREPEEMAGRISRYLNRELGEQMSAAISENTILDFIAYLNPQPRQLGAEMVARSAQLAKTLVPAPAQVAIFFSPAPDAAERIPYLRELVYELYQNFNEMYQMDSSDPDRITLFRRFDGLSLDNLDTFLQSLPPRMNPSELKPLVLWAI